jgi:hypothetical protein
MSRGWTWTGRTADVVQIVTAALPEWLWPAIKAAVIAGLISGMRWVVGRFSHIDPFWLWVGSSVFVAATIWSFVGLRVLLPPRARPQPERSVGGGAPAIHEFVRADDLPQEWKVLSRFTDKRAWVEIPGFGFELREGALDYYESLDALDQEKIRQAMMTASSDRSVWSKKDFIRIADAKEALRMDLNELLTEGNKLLVKFHDSGERPRLSILLSGRGPMTPEERLQEEQKELRDWCKRVRDCLREHEQTSEGYFMGCSTNRAPAERLECHLEKLRDLYRAV